MLLKKKLSIQLVVSSVLAMCFVFFISDKSYALANSQKPTEVVANYSLSSVDPDTLTKFETMEGVNTFIHDKTLTVRMILPETDNTNDVKNSNTELLDTTSDYNQVNFSDMVESMDDNNGNQNVADGTPVNSDGTVNTLSINLAKSYKGQTYSGEKVKTGTHVHCNRFNGTSSDHKYWSKLNPKALVDFYHSDCDYHAIAYGCSSMSSMTKCDGLNKKHKGVKDCSSWSGKGHHNWHKTAWYRN